MKKCIRLIIALLLLYFGYQSSFGQSYIRLMNAYGFEATSNEMADLEAQQSTSEYVSTALPTLALRSARGSSIQPGDAALQTLLKKELTMPDAALGLPVRHLPSGLYYHGLQQTERRWSGQVQFRHLV